MGVVCVCVIRTSGPSMSFYKDFVNGTFFNPSFNHKKKWWRDKGKENGTGGFHGVLWCNGEKQISGAIPGRDVYTKCLVQDTNYRRKHKKDE